MNSSSSFIIRQAVPADQAAVEACIEASFSKWIPSMGMKPMALLADYQTLIGRQVTYVIESGTTTAGVLLLWPEQDSMYIDTIAVNPAFQKQGIGARLMNYAEERARSAGLNAMTLITNVKMEANIAYYQRWGYRETERREVTPGRVAVFMRKSLQAE